MFFGFLLRNMRGYRFLAIIAVSMAFLQVVASIILVSPTKFVIDKSKGADPSLPPIPQNIVNAYFSLFDGFGTKAGLRPPEVHPVLGVIIGSAALFIIFSILLAMLSYIQVYLATFLAQNLSARLRKRLFEHLQRLSLDWHGKQKKGDLVQRITSNIADIEKFVTDGLVDLLTDILTIVLVIVVMLSISVPYTMLSIVIVPPLAVVTISFTLSIKKAAKKTSKATGEVADVAVEDVGAITVLKAFALEQREAARFGKYVEKTREAGLHGGSLQALFTPIVAVLTAIAFAIILGVGAVVAFGNSVSILGIITIPGFNVLHPQVGSFALGTVTFYLALFTLFFQPFKDLAKLSNVLNSAAAGAERIQEVLDQAPEVTESKTPYTGPKRLQGDIAFENVLFGYTPEKLILKGINLRIPAGKKVALVGLSGGGKTTLVKLIPRFYEVTQGSVKIDGQDTRLYPLSIVRQNVSMVLQESVMFEGTILENLKIGRPEATMEEVIDAAKQAQIHDAIMDMPDNYNTLVRNQGKNFSGGQRQRMAIARAILSKSPILILDEPTASLDVEAEAEVMNALDRLVVGRTVLMISHRLSTLGQVDEIIVLKDGRIVEQGTYKDLRRAGGVFAGLLKEQNRYNIEDVGRSIVAPKNLAILLEQQIQAQGQRQVPPPPQPHPWQPAQPFPARPQPIQASGYAQNGGQQRWDQIQPQPQPQRQPAPVATFENASMQIEVNGSVIGERRLDKPLLTVGRLSGNDIRVPAERVSRLHARVRWENGTWLIEDADSLNGITYGGNRIDKHVLSNGDRILLAPTAAIVYTIR